MPKQSCQSCKFWKDLKCTASEPNHAGRQEPEGLCTRHAPQPYAHEVRLDRPRIRWPKTNASDACGEWQPAPTQNTMTPSEEQTLKILPHIRYELDMLFYTPGVKGHLAIENAVLESRLLHARSLNAFFSPARRVYPDDVRPEHFGFTSKDTGVDVNTVDRLHKDLAHISYRRLDRTPDTKKWLGEDFAPQLATRSIEFIRHVLTKYADRLDEKERASWEGLLNHLTTPTHQMPHVPSSRQ